LLRNPAVVIKVVDAATGALVPMPTFSNHNGALDAMCGSDTWIGGDSCVAWWIFHGTTRDEITTAAPGYTSQTIATAAPTVDGDNCTLEDVHETVTLDPAP